MIWAETLSVWSVPSYGGRVPGIAAKRMENLRGGMRTRGRGDRGVRQPGLRRYAAGDEIF